MRFSFSSMVRLALAAILVSSAAAIGLARITPAPKGWRMPQLMRYTPVNAFFLDQCHRGSAWVDREGGPVLDLPYRDGELLEYASCSPWRDERGRVQVVGRWSSSYRDGAPGKSFGVARFSFPDGEILDHVETDVVPMSSPCWYPGTQARVLFAAGDGKLYQYAFEAGQEGRAEEREPSWPRAITWNCPTPGGGEVYLSEPHLPSDRRFSHLVFVGLRKTGTSRDRPASDVNQIWWLRFSDDGSSIEEAGRMLESPAGGQEADERCPTFAMAPGGRPVLAYYLGRGRRTSELHVALIELDPEGRRPRPIGGPGMRIADDCLGIPPIFSRDGEWISIVQGIGIDRGIVRRIPLDLGAEVGEQVTSSRLVEHGTSRR